MQRRGMKVRVISLQDPPANTSGWKKEAQGSGCITNINDGVTEGVKQMMLRRGETSGADEGGKSKVRFRKPLPEHAAWRQGLGGASNISVSCNANRVGHAK